MDRDNSPEGSSISKMSKRKGDRSDVNSPNKTDVERRKKKKRTTDNEDDDYESPGIDRKMKSRTKRKNVEMDDDDSGGGGNDSDGAASPRKKFNRRKKDGPVETS